MTFVLMFILLFVATVVIGVAVNAANSKKDRRTLQRIMSQYKAEDAYVSGHALIALNFKERKIILASGGRAERVYDFAQIASVEVVENGASVTQTNRGSQLLGAVVGGLAFGGIGAVVGGLSGSSRTRERLRSISLKIVVDDREYPVYKISFFESSDEKGADREGILTRMPLQYVERFHGHIVNAMRQRHSNPSDAPRQSSTGYVETKKREILQNSPVVSYCTGCGTALHGGARFCSSCGATVEPQQQARLIVTIPNVFCSTCGARIRNSQGICIRCEDPQERDAVGATAKEVGSVSDSPEPESVKSDAVAPNSAGSPLSASATSNPVNTTGKLFLKLFFGLIGIFAIIIGLIEITSQQQRNDSRTSNKLREAVPIPASNQSQPQTARPLIPPPKFRIYKFKNDGISPTSVVVPINTTDDQLKSLIWFFREKVRSHDFKSLKVKEARDGMFAVYRGEKCANEQFIDASGPCGDGEHDDAFYQWGIEADPNKDSGSIKVKGDFVVVFNYEDGWQVAPLR